MSEDRNIVVSSTIKDENFGNGTANGNNPQPLENSGEQPSIENFSKPAKQENRLQLKVQTEPLDLSPQKITPSETSAENQNEILQPAEASASEDMSLGSSSSKVLEVSKNMRTLGIVYSEKNVKVTHSSLEQNLTTPEKEPTKSPNEIQPVAEAYASEKTSMSSASSSKTLEVTHDIAALPFEQNLTTSETESSDNPNEIRQPANASGDISVPLDASSGTALKEVTENIQRIYEGLKDMKLSAEENLSGKKGRKLPSTPRARSTPVKPLTSPPLTRSRSRDLRKFPSTPSSPKRLAKSEGGSDEKKEGRGRQREKKNLP